MKEGFQSLYSC